jgi:excisionase family DNA binding protein
MMQPLLDAADVAELLNVKKSWVYAEARAGRIPHVRIGRYRRFHRDSVEHWTRQLERPQPERRTA